MIEPLRTPPITFAHRGGQAHAPANTIEAFGLALSMGATGLETDAWLTADGKVVLHHDGALRRGLRHRRFRHLQASDLPEWIPTLADLYQACGSDFELSIDLKDPAAIDGVVAAANDAGSTERLWLCHPDWRWLAERRDAMGTAHLVHTTTVRGSKVGAERLAAHLAEAGIEAVNLNRSEWSGGLTTLFHRFGVLSFAWDALHEREIRELLRMGVDAVYSDHVDRLIAASGGGSPFSGERSEP